MADAPDQHTLRAALRDIAGFHSPTPLRIATRRPLAAMGAMRAEELSLATPGEPPIRAILTGPAGPWHAQPAVLYCHAHGNRHAMGANELTEGRPALLPEPYGPALARRGVVALSIDMPCFGERAFQSESALAKRLHWEGKTLFGRMLADLAGALAILAAQDGVDPARIGVFGFSMGATHAFWLGALEPRIARIAHACAFADLRELVACGAHDLHGPYMTVPGLLARATTGQIAGLCAPRPQLAAMGARDPLTPPAALDAGVSDLRRSYSDRPQTLHVLIEDVGHVETPAMRRAVLDFLAGEAA